MKKVNVTEMEKQFIDALINTLYAEPGFSDVGIQDIADIILYPINVCKGVLGSLVKKGLCNLADDPAFADIIYLPRSLYHMHPEWKACTISDESIELNVIESSPTKMQLLYEELEKEFIERNEDLSIVLDDDTLSITDFKHNMILTRELERMLNEAKKANASFFVHEINKALFAIIHLRK